MQDLPFFSVIIPVKNEAALLSRCLSSLQELDYPRSRLEVIVADGESVDETREVALRYGATVVRNEKQIVASGRNRGFEKARGDFIVFTDADCVFEREWLKNSIKYFDDPLVGGVSGPARLPGQSPPFERAVNLLFRLAGCLGATSHIQNTKRLRTVQDIPGCNAFYRREALAKAMPVEEGLLTAEDVWMNYIIRKHGYTLLMAPDVALWHQRRSSFKRFMRQVYRFAIGRVQVARKERSLIGIFHILAGLSLLYVPAIVWYLCFAGGWRMLCPVAAALVAVSAAAAWIMTHSLRGALYFPLVVALFASCWSAGFLRELFFPLKETRGR